MMTKCALLVVAMAAALSVVGRATETHFYSETLKRSTNSSGALSFATKLCGSDSLTEHLKGEALMAEAATKGGSVAAQKKLAALLDAEGKPGAMEMYALAAKNGDAKSQQIYGKYLINIGRTDEGKALLAKVAEQGGKVGRSATAAMARETRKQNDAEAFAWNESAENFTALANMSKDRIEKCKWFRVAMARDPNRDHASGARRILHGKEFTPDELAEGEKQAVQYLKQRYKSTEPIAKK